MGVQETQSAVVTSGGSTTDTLGQLFTVTGTSDPAYLVVDALDRNEYTVSGNGDTGVFSGGGNTLDLGAIGGDGRGAGIVFTWQASSDSYVNATYGAFSQLDFTSSDSPDDVTNISVFTTSSASLANACAANAYALMQEDPSGYVGSVTFANDPNFSGAVPAQATPDAVAAAALKFVGDAWNDEGCWVLASAIAAEAGAGLPVQSTVVGVAGHANGEWVVIYNGPVASGANWQNLVSTGDMISFVTASGGGHITTCVSGSGATAMLVDNVTYENARGQITNSANDGSRNDVLVSAPHPASQEWSGVSGSSVVIYALDTPLISNTVAAAQVNTGGTLSLSSVFSAKDPAGKAITQYQVYNTAGGDSILLGGKLQGGATSSDPVTATSLASLALLAGANAATDTLEIRAFNGTYWGDWQSLVVNVVVPVPKPPVLAAQTASQSWHQGQAVNFILPASVFRDPQGQALTYSASGAAGAALPSWLTFNPATRDFTGTVPAAPQSFTVTVTATDTSGLSGTEVFTVNVAAAPPTLAIRTPAQSFAEGSSINLALPGGTFVDPQGENLTYKAALSSGAVLPAWLHFNPGSLTFSGTAPTAAATLQLKVTATDTSNLSVSDIFTASVSKQTGHVVALSDWQAAIVPETRVIAVQSAAARLLDTDWPNSTALYIIAHH